jgi:hypothetical protein
MPDAGVDRVHHRGGRRTIVTQFEGVTVLVQRHGLDIDGGQRLVDRPWIAYSVFGLPKVSL